MSKASNNARLAIQKEMADREKLTNGLSNSLGALTGAMTGAVKALANGETSFNTMSGVVEGAAKAASALASTLGPLGAVVGKAFEAAAAANSVLVGQLQVSYTAFKQMNSIGLVSNFKELRDISADTGVRMEKMGEVLTPLSKDLARMGGANGGMSQLAKLGKASSDLRDNFYRMGINAQQFMEYQAEYISQGQRTGTTKGLSEKQLIDGTKRYIEQLDDLTKLTGMSRKEIQEARKSLQGDSQYRAMMADKNTNQKEGMEGVLVALKAQFGDEIAKGAQHAASGMFNSPESKKFLMTMGGDTTMMQETLERLSKAETPEARAKITAEVMARAQKGAGETEETRRQLAIAGKGGNVFADYAKVADGQAYNVEGAAASVEEGRGKREKLLSGDDPASKYGDLEKQLDQTSLKLQQFATGSDVAFKSVQFAAEMTDKFIDASIAAIDTASKLSDKFKDLSGTTLAMAFAGIGAAAVYASKKLMDLGKMSGAPGAPDPGGKGGGKGGGGKGGLGTVGKIGIAGIAGTAMEMGGDALKEAGHEKTGGAVAAAGTAASWAATGAMVGSVVPGVGTAAGAIVGGTAGFAKGLYDNWGSMFGGGKGDYEKFIAFGSESGSKSNFEQLDPAFKEKVIAASKAYYEATGKKIQINSAFRDPEKQKELYDKWNASGRQGKPVAPPGASLHNRGAAVDIQNYNDQEAVKAFNAQGLSQKVPNDPVHFQARTGGIFKGPSTGYNVELHGDEAVIPMNDGVSKQAMNNSMFNQDSTTIKMVADALEGMNAKFDEIIDLLDDANGHHKKLVQAAA
jgi:hypothetical protein